MRIRKLNHSMYRTQYHIVWVTKYRKKWIKDYVKVELLKALYKAQRRHPAWYFLAINTDKDHVHLQMEIPPSDSVAAVVQDLKASSAQIVRKRFPFLNKIYYGHSGLWSTGYFVSTIGLDEATVRRYVELQGQDDFGQDVTSEFS